MALTGTDIAVRARTLLNDDTGVRWTDAELLRWINDGRREMAALKPKVFGQTSHTTHTLDAGAYQTLGLTGAYAIADITRNTSGSAVRVVTRESLDTFRPGWVAETGAAVQNWVPDATNPLAFWVFPSVTGASIDVLALVTPPDLPALTSTALPFDQYLTPLTNYVMHRALAKDAEVAANAALSAAYLTLFSTALSA